QRNRIDAERLHQTERLLAVGEWRFDALSAAVRDPQPAARRELVTLRVAAEIVVVVEDENARPLACVSTIEMGRRQPADTAAYHDQVVDFARINGVACRGPEPSVAERVRHVKGPFMAPAHAR